MRKIFRVTIMVLIAALFFVIITMSCCSNHSYDDGNKAISSIQEKLSKNGQISSSQGNSKTKDSSNIKSE